MVVEEQLESSPMCLKVPFSVNRSASALSESSSTCGMNEPSGKRDWRIAGGSIVCGNHEEWNGRRKRTIASSHLGVAYGDLTLSEDPEGERRRLSTR